MKGTKLGRFLFPAHEHEHEHEHEQEQEHEHEQEARPESQPCRPLFFLNNL
jgi:hypothetical protein